jgi:hypothetical protein
VTGGEPLLSKEVFRLFSELIRSPLPLLQLAINSNMGFTPARLKNFQSVLTGLQGAVKEVKIYTSIDSVGIQAEYIRYGLKYEEYFQNIESLLEGHPRLKIDFMLTVNALSLPGMPHLISRILELKRKFPSHHIHFDTSMVVDPKHLSINILPPEFSRFIDDTIAIMKANMHTQDHPGFLETDVARMNRVKIMKEGTSLSPDEHRRLKRDFYSMLIEYDKRRRTNFSASFPEYSEFWSDCAKS